MYVLVLYTCAGQFPLVSMGDERTRQACADGERGPPSARAEILKIMSFFTHIFLSNGLIRLVENILLNALSMI